MILKTAMFIQIRLPFKMTAEIKHKAQDSLRQMDEFLKCQVENVFVDTWNFNNQTLSM